MNTYLTIAVCLCAVVILTDGVVVKVGDFSFPWESVKKLKEVQRSMPARNPRLRSRSNPTICDAPDLPEEFLSVCKSSNPNGVFSRLASIMAEERVCEICANVACSGC